jgi:mevalonate kinase
MKSFFLALEKVSAFQLKYFTKMIPCNFTKSWIWGLESGCFNLKLCGSGGGGFLLGFTNNYLETKNYFKDLNHEVIPVYKST